MSGFFKQPKQGASTGSTLTPNVGQYGWTLYESQSVSQIIGYVNEAKGYAVESATSANASRASAELALVYVNEAKAWAGKAEVFSGNSKDEADRSERYANQSVDIYNAFLNVAANQRITETFDLTTAQTVVDFVKVFADASYISVNGQRVDSSNLVKDLDYTVTGISQITLKRRYPVGTKLTAVQDIKKDDSIPGVSESSSIWNRQFINALVGVSYGDYVDQGRTFTPRLVFEGGQYLPTYDSSEAVTFTDIPVKLNDGTILVNTSKGQREFSKNTAEAVARGDDFGVSFSSAKNSPVKRSLADRFADTVHARDFGAVGDGVTDDTDALQAAIDACKISGAVLNIHSGEFKITRTLSVNGVSILGNLSGYFNRQGTTIKGNGTFDIIAQTAYGAKDITNVLRNIRVIGGLTGFNFAYVVNCVFENLFIEECAVGFRLGRKGLFGPLFNELVNINTRKMTQYGVVIGGDTNCNNNIFRQGFYDGKTAGFYQESVTGGTGAVNNLLDMVELGGSGSDIGAIFKGVTVSTTIRDCYFEPQGTNVMFRGTTQGCTLENNLYAGHFKFGANDALVVSKLISSISFNGGFIYHGNAADKNFFFFKADYADEARYRDKYVFVSEPVYEDKLTDKTYQGLTSYEQGNFRQIYTSNATRVLLNRDTTKKGVKMEFLRDVGTLNDWTTLATVQNARISFAHSMCRFKVTGSCRNKNDYYLLGFDLDVTYGFNETAMTKVEHLFSLQGTAVVDLIEYQVIYDGGNVLFQVRNKDTANTDQAVLHVEVIAVGSNIRDVV